MALLDARKKKSWRINIILLIYFLIHIIIIAGLKSHMIETSRKRDKEESIDLSDMPPLGSVEEEVNKGKGVKILTPNKLLTRLPVLIG